MQKLYLTILLAPVLFLTSCVIYDPDGCRHVSTTLVAKDANKGGDNPGGTTKISIRPDTVKIVEGCRFTINNPGGHEISMVKKTTGAWLDVEPTKDDLRSEVSVKTDPGSDEEELFEYTIIVTGMGELDPRARVL